MKIKVRQERIKGIVIVAVAFVILIVVMAAMFMIVRYTPDKGKDERLCFF